MSEPDDLLPPQSLRTMQIIAGALLSGVLLFLAVAMAIAFGEGIVGGVRAAGRMPALTIVAILFLVIDGPLALLIPSFQTKNALKNAAEGRSRSPSGGGSGVGGQDASLLALRMRTLIVSLAILEGAAFLGCIAFLVEGLYFALIPVAVAILLMLAQFPTEYRVRSWLDRQNERLIQLRQQNGAM